MTLAEDTRIYVSLTVRKMHEKKNPDITDILLKVALNIISLNYPCEFWISWFDIVHEIHKNWFTRNNNEIILFSTS
jgi:hypothetical protein